MRKFPGSRGNFSFNRVEHDEAEYRSQKPEARREKAGFLATDYHPDPQSFAEASR
jgi:hypothetical protein